jgi:curved DNA-binding protein
VDLYTAVLGGKISINTFKGKMSVTIPPGTQPDKVFKLTGLGMPHFNHPQKKGDLYLAVKLSLPERLSEKERALFRELADLHDKQQAN